VSRRRAIVLLEVVTVNIRDEEEGKSSDEEH
jgi:hypothetical protein